MKLFKIFLVLIPVGIIVYFGLQWPHSIKRNYGETFYLSDDYNTVRKIFVRTDAVDRMLAANNARIIDKKVEGLSLASDRIFNNPNWVVDFGGVFTIAFNDCRFGKREVVLRQHARITPQDMFLEAYMPRPCGELQDYEFEMKMSSRKGGGTEVEINITVGIKYYSPNIEVIHRKVERQLERSLVEGVTKTKSAFKACVQEYRGKKFILRLPVKS